MLLMVKVIPNAHKTALDSFQDGVLKVRVQAPPDKGKANEALIAFLARTFKIAKNRIRILSGHSSRLKKVEISGEVPFCTDRSSFFIDDLLNKC
jgi:uncharacterized protein